jgi:hypothetical protein
MCALSRNTRSPFANEAVRCRPGRAAVPGPPGTTDFENGQNAMDGTIEKTELLLVEIRVPAVSDMVEVMTRELTTVSDNKRNRWRSGDLD